MTHRFVSVRMMSARIASARAKASAALFATVAAATLVAFAGVSQSMAQQKPPAKPAQPAKPAPQQPAQQQPAQQPTPAEPQLIFSPWVKLCNKDPAPNSKQICVTVKDGRIESGLLVVSVALIEMEGEQRKLVRVSMPYGVALQHGTRLIVDQDTPATSPFVTCLPPVVPPGGCIADYEASVDMINRMKKGKMLTVQAIHMNGQPMSPQLALERFRQGL